MPYIFLNVLNVCCQQGTFILDESLNHSIISKELIQSYVAAHYQFILDSNIQTLHIGQHSESIAKLMRAKGVQCALYITACNPYSQAYNSVTNSEATLKLASLLATYSNHIFTGQGLDPAGNWPAEQSFLALGIDLTTSKALGEQFNQNAIVWIASDAIPKLILLR